MSYEGSVTVWTDPSLLGLGVALEVDGRIVEDTSWLGKKSDYFHINVAKLEAVARGSTWQLRGGLRLLRLPLIHSQ